MTRRILKLTLIFADCDNMRAQLSSQNRSIMLCHASVR